MNTAEHMTLAKPAAWCDSGSPGGATYGVSSSSGFARAISAAGLGCGSGADGADLAATVVKCCVWAPVTTNANKNALTNARMKYVLLVSGARSRKGTGGSALATSNGTVVWMSAATTSCRFCRVNPMSGEVVAINASLLAVYDYTPRKKEAFVTSNRVEFKLSVIAWTRPYGHRWRVSTYRTPRVFDREILSVREIFPRLW